MISIDRLSLHFPPGFEARTADIVRRLGHELAALPIDEHSDLARLRIDGLAITASMTNAQIAQQIAGGIRDALMRPGPPSPAANRRHTYQ